MNINDLLNEMECYAKSANVPIMLLDAINYICDLIQKQEIKSVLEIGTAIGYSTIKMCKSGTYVTSIERDKERYNLAVSNVKKANMQDRINLILGDAFDTNIEDKFDMILIDAAKGKNIEFIEKFKINLKSNGLIIIDNVLFHGLVGKSDTIKSRNLRSLVRKIERFLDYLDSQNEFTVSRVDLGDGLIILKEKKDE